jgi:hypothetical protein
MRKATQAELTELAFSVLFRGAFSPFRDGRNLRTILI